MLNLIELRANFIILLTGFLSALKYFFKMTLGYCKYFYTTFISTFISLLITLFLIIIISD